MKTDRFESWLQNIYGTQDEEISCSECLDLVSHFVDSELANQDAAAELPQVKQHLDQCSACHDEYEALRDLGRWENEGGPTSLDDPQSLIP